MTKNMVVRKRDYDHAFRPFQTLKWVSAVHAVKK